MINLTYHTWLWPEATSWLNEKVGPQRGWSDLPTDRQAQKPKDAAYWCHLDWPTYCMGQEPKGSPGSSFKYKQVWDDLKLNYLQIITYSFPKLRCISKVLEFWYIYLKQGLLFSVLNFKYACIWTFEWSLLKYNTLKKALEWWCKVVLCLGLSRKDTRHNEDLGLNGQCLTFSTARRAPSSSVCVSFILPPFRRDCIPFNAFCNN